jgi:hypothetical protein
MKISFHKIRIVGQDFNVFHLPDFCQLCPFFFHLVSILISGAVETLRMRDRNLCFLKYHRCKVFCFNHTQVCEIDTRCGVLTVNIYRIDLQVLTVYYVNKCMVMFFPDFYLCCLDNSFTDFWIEINLRSLYAAVVAYFFQLTVSLQIKLKSPPHT